MQACRYCGSFGHDSRESGDGVRVRLGGPASRDVVRAAYVIRVCVRDGAGGRRHVVRAAALRYRLRSLRVCGVPVLDRLDVQREDRRCVLHTSVQPSSVQPRGKVKGKPTPRSTVVLPVFCCVPSRLE